MAFLAELFALISLNTTLALVQAGQVAKTLSITGATVTTPIQITCVAHGMAPALNAHGVVSGVTGTVEANALWELSYVDPNTLSLATYSPQGGAVPSVGVNAYTGGGIVQIAFPDWRILLGRRQYARASGVASPRIVFIPTQGRAWGLEPYGGLTEPAPPQQKGSVEAQYEKLNPQIATEYTTFDVYVTGCAATVAGEIPSPDFGDFDACQAIVYTLYGVLFRACGATVKVLREDWPSQKETSGTLSQRGQQWRGLIEFQRPIANTLQAYVPDGTSFVVVVEPENPLVPNDQVTIDVAPT